MEVLVGKDGKIMGHKVLKSDGEGFTKACEEALKGYRYKPGTRKGTPVSFTVIERFEFKLDK